MKQEKGQSLVEMALITPVLIIMFIGVFEVGFAIRAYMTVLNANREAARFVARSLYTDDEAYRHFNDVVSPTVLSDVSNTTVYIRRFEMVIGNPFSADDNVYTDTLRVYGSLHPSSTNVPNLAAEVIGLSNVVNTNQYTRELVIACNDPLMAFRCDALTNYDFQAAPVDWYQEEFVYVEAYHDHDQIIGLFGQLKIPLYTQTMMRISSSRGR